MEVLQEEEAWLLVRGYDKDVVESVGFEVTHPSYGLSRAHREALV
jgi:hypothetical protein